MRVYTLRSEIFSYLELENGLSWKGPKSSSSSNPPLPRAGSPSSEPGLSNPHSAYLIQKISKQVLV